MSFTIKICGITRLEDAREAVALGADALGFMFYARSSRHISVEAAAAICHDLPRSVLRVGVFVDAPLAEIEAAARACGLNFVQLHGAETPQFCDQVTIAPVVKAFRVSDERSLESLPHYRTALWLLDSYVPGALGGTGHSFDWRLAQAAHRVGTPFWLAGGLTPENVGEAIREARPAGVDVSSGVESGPGRKDHDKMKAFIEAARKAAGALKEEVLVRV